VTALAHAGHNGPPPFEAYSLHIEDLFTQVSDSTAGIAVENDAQEAALDALLDEFRAARKNADAERVAEKRPHDDAGKAVQAKWKPLIDRCDMAAGEIKRLLTPYRTIKQRAKDEVARLAREEADARQKAAQEALRASDDLEQRFAAEADLERAAKLTAQANRIDRSATGLRNYYRAEITDHVAFCRWAWTSRRADYEAFLTDLAEREVRRGPVTIPGIIIHTEERAV
jgi:hypothetical protein